MGQVRALCCCLAHTAVQPGVYVLFYLPLNLVKNSLEYWCAWVCAVSPCFWWWPICTALLLYPPESQLLQLERGICPAACQEQSYGGLQCFTMSQNWLNCRLEGTSWDYLVQSHLLRGVSKSRFLRPVSSCVFSISGDGCSTTSLYNLFQYLTTLTVKTVFSFV